MKFWFVFRTRHSTSHLIGVWYGVVLVSVSVAVEVVVRTKMGNKSSASAKADSKSVAARHCPTRYSRDEFHSAVTDSLADCISIHPLLQLITTYSYVFVGVLDRITFTGTCKLTATATRTATGKSKSNRTFTYSYGLTNDVSGSDFVLIAATNHHVIMRCSLKTGHAEPAFGTGQAISKNTRTDSALDASFLYPGSICVDSHVRGRYFIGELYAVRVCEPRGGVWTVAGKGSTEGQGAGADGVGECAEFNRVSCIVQDKSGDRLFVVDSNHGKIRRIDISTQIVATVAGGGGGALTVLDGTGTAAGIPFPLDMVWSSLASDEPKTVLFITDGTRIRRFDTVSGAVTCVQHRIPIAESNRSGAHELFGIAATSAGLLLVAAQNKNCVYSVDPVSGTTNRLCGDENGLAGTGVGDALDEARLSGPLALEISSDERQLYISDGQGISLLSLK